VWQASPVAGTNVVDVYVNYLRRKLGVARAEAYGEGMDSEPEQDRVIETVRGEGYVMPCVNEKKPSGSVRSTGNQWVSGRLASA
jgi:DNA-binding response OmpR family regulator